MATEEVEKEFKNLLTKAQYENLLQHFPFEPPFIQANYYFDTQNGTLHQQNWGLRIRIFKEKAEETLKTPTQKQGMRTLLETTEPLSVSKATQLVEKDQILAKGKISDELHTINVSQKDLSIVGKSKTVRQLCHIDAGLLTLDKTTFSAHTDYELELEVQNTCQGQEFFLQLLQAFKIDILPVTNKVQRAIADYRANHSS